MTEDNRRRIGVITMVYELEDLSELFSYLESLGVRLAIIGSTSLQYHMGIRKFEDDLDLFVYEGSLLLEEERLRSDLARLGWDVGLTEFSTPKVIMRRGDEEIEVELYENIHDFYIPLELIERARDITVKDHRLKILLPEQYLVLKARAGRDKDLEDLRVYSDMIKEGKLRISISLIRENASLFEEERIIISRLRSSGIKI
ncbi:MAG: nucleotidyltransferase [Sulfolobales archaeon]